MIEHSYIKSVIKRSLSEMYGFKFTVIEVKEQVYARIERDDKLIREQWIYYAYLDDCEVEFDKFKSWSLYHEYDDFSWWIEKIVFVIGHSYLVIRVERWEYE